MLAMSLRRFIGHSLARRALSETVSSNIPTAKLWGATEIMLTRPFAASAARSGGGVVEDAMRPLSEDDEVNVDEGDEANSLEGKETRENIHSSFKNRSADAMRYDYFAQRAELEAETEAATLFRSLSETCRQQALGYLELLEEYDDAEFGSTMTNLQVATDSERENADGSLRDFAGVAADDGFQQIEEWFDDIADASHRAATRLESVHALLEDELVDADVSDMETMNGDMLDDDSDVDDKYVKRKSGGRSTKTS